MMIDQVALLSWVTPSEVKPYYKKIQCQIDSQTKMVKEKDRWKSHALYKQNTKENLEAMCKKLQVPVTAAMAKHQLVEIITEQWCCASKGQYELTVQWKHNSFAYIHVWSEII